MRKDGDPTSEDPVRRGDGASARDGRTTHPVEEYGGNGTTVRNRRPRDSAFFIRGPVKGDGPRLELLHGQPFEPN
ncbi:unnamed protein product, partial [Nesidiocoris tenuis]